MIALARATLCINCEGVFDGSAGGICPGCQSPQVMPIARWLNRAAAPTPTPPRIDLVVSPLELLALATEQGIDVTPETWR